MNAGVHRLVGVSGSGSQGLCEANKWKIKIEKENGRLKERRNNAGVHR